MTTGMGSKYGLQSGRNLRSNYPNIYYNSTSLKMVDGGPIAGEGVYGCYNSGRLISNKMPLHFQNRVFARTNI